MTAGEPAAAEPVDYFGRHAPALLRFKTAQSLRARRAMFDEFLRLTGARPGQRARERAMTSFWIWLVPSTICSTFASRR